MPKRTWTDSEIAELKRLYGTMPLDDLIAQQFPTKTRSSIKWQVERWRLGQKEYWSDRDKEILRILCSCNVPAGVAGELLNRPTLAVNVMASKLGFLRKTRNEQPSLGASTQRTRYDELDSLTKGTVNELKVVCALLEDGLSVYRPLMINHKTDLVVLHGHVPLRIQVKTGIYDEHTKRYRVPLRSRAVNKGIRTSYKADDVDYFIVTCPGNDTFYIIPYEHAMVTEFANLYPTRIKQQHSGTDFEQFRNRFDLLRSAKATQSSITTLATPADRLKSRFADSTKGRPWNQWEDDTLRLLLSNGVPYSVLASTLKRSQNSVVMRANRLGLISEGVNAVSDSHAFDLHEASTRLDSKILGVITENLVANELLWRGFDVFAPCRTNDRADFAVLGGSLAARVQVKGATYDTKAKCYRALTSTKSMKTGLRKTYSASEVELILVNCGFGPDVYVIPIGMVQERQAIRLYPDRHAHDKRGPAFDVFLNRYDLLVEAITDRNNLSNQGVVLTGDPLRGSPAAHP